ncbi:MAG: ATP-binding protein [Clostridiales bacterium]|jgi:hypothetical protein|nr:ATP-binding protein [Clostridiales bacterium]
MSKKIPYNISNYSKLIEEGNLFVDKTRYIDILERDASYIAFFRPRRFGKSLFLSTLEHYYDYRKVNSNLFENTWIGSHPTKLKNSMAVLNFDFSGFSSDNSDDLLSEFSVNAATSLDDFMKTNEIETKDVNFNLSPAQFLNQFFLHAARSLKFPIYLLIDEYDHYANNMLGANPEEFKAIVSKNGFVRNFFEVIKIAAKKGIVNRIFLTGVSPITLDSLTSGFNIALNVSRTARFHDMMGFTQEEVKYLIDESLSEHAADKAATLSSMLRLYNGYRFRGASEAKLFNSGLALYYLHEYSKSGSQPDELFDPNILSDWSKIHSIASIDIGEVPNWTRVQLMQAKERRSSALVSVSGGELQKVSMTSAYDLRKFDLDDFLSFLFYAGYLTIDSSSNGYSYLTIPNAILKNVFDNYFLDMIVKPAVGLDDEMYEKAMNSIAFEGKTDMFVACISHVLQNQFRRMYLKFTESNFQQIAFFIASLYSGYSTDVEMELKGVRGGFIDLALLPNDSYSVNYYGLIELKYLKSYEINDGNIMKKWNDGYMKLKKYSSNKLFSQLNKEGRLKRWIIIFSTHNCLVNQEITDDANLEMKVYDNQNCL